jgi:hypothetical protein
MTMSRHIHHRGAEPVHQAPAAVRPAASAMAKGGLPLDLTCGDRFRRTLGAVRRDALQTGAEVARLEEAGLPLFTDDARAAIKDESRRAPTSEPDEALLDKSVAERDEPGPDDTSDSPEDSPQAQRMPDAKTIGTVPAPTAQRELGTVQGGANSRSDENGSSSTKPPASGTTAIKSTDGLPAWLHETTQQIEWLCSRADPSFQTWAVTVPMDPTTLPETELALQLSPFSLTLRFRTHSEHSARLVSRHRGQLLALLEKLPALPSTIDIDLE